MKTRHFDRIGNGGITFTELGFGAAPLGNLYRAISDEDANATLQAVGGLGIGHIQSSLGLIGVTADAFAKDVYTPKQVEDLMNGTINGIESVKKLLRRLQDNELTDDDEEYIDRMINVYNALQREAKALVTFAKSKKPADAEIFDTARKAAVLKLAQLTEGDKIPVQTPTDKTE